ncbi:ribosome silencing factor [bacterium]|nr:ribosome silencing factor [bacterium]
MKLSSEYLVDLIVAQAQAKNARDIQVLDLRKLTTVTDFFIVCTGDASVHVRAIASAILDNLQNDSQRAWHREGMDTGNWVLLDYVDVVVHVFMPEQREFFSLERLWGDAKIRKIPTLEA